MLQNIPKMLEITQAVVDAVDIPVTVKTRLGWDESSKVIVDLAERLQDCGIRALTIHVSSSVMSATISLAFSSLVCARTPDTLMPDTAVTLINKASIAEIIFLFFMLTYHSFPYLWMPYLHENAADR